MKNRKIIFRVWYPKLKEFEPEAGYVYIKNGTGTPHLYGRNGLRPLADDECIISQFTGLLDKNGKEIYEGDIVKNRFGILFKFVVIDLLALGFETIGKNRGIIAQGNNTNKWSCIPEKVEVIGNIYENPELLKGGSDE